MTLMIGDGTWEIDCTNLRIDDFAYASLLTVRGSSKDNCKIMCSHGSFYGIRVGHSGAAAATAARPGQARALLLWCGAWPGD